MPRGHFKSIAIYSLISVLVANPIMAASPGDASRRAAASGNSSRRTGKTTTQQHSNTVQNAVDLRPLGQKAPIQQVVGKQPVAPKKDPNRSLSLLPSIFGSTRNATSTSTNSPKSSNRTTSRNTTNTQRRVTNTTQAKPAANNTVRSSGILSDIFGNRSKQTTQNRAAPQADTPAPKVDWQGIPYHQARSKPSAKTPAPIRDPNPGETRIASSSRLSPQRTSPKLARPAPQISSAVPRPPALAEAPSSRRTTKRVKVTEPTKVASSQNNNTRTASSVLSPLSSSRRSGRRDVPTLDASEIAAARSTSVPKEDLVPKVARRTLAAETTPAKPNTKAVAKTETKPVESPKPATTPKVEAKPTPSVEIAVKPQPKTTPEMQSLAANSTPVAMPNTDVAESAKPDTTVAATVPVTPNAVATQPVSEQPVATLPNQPTPPVPAQVPTAQVPATNIAAGPSVSEPAALPAPTVPANPPTERVAVAAPAPAPMQPSAKMTPPSPTTPQFVAPRLPVPAAPQFGAQASVARHRIGPPASAFQSRAQPRAALNPPHVPFGPTGTPIGSGIATQPAPAPYTPPATAYVPTAQPHQNTIPTSPRQAPTQHRYQPDPYAQPAMPYASQPSQAYVPEIASARSSLGTPRAPARIAPTPVPPTHNAMAPPAPVAPSQPSYPQNTSSAFSQTPFAAPQPSRTVSERSPSSELPPGQTAVASELPGIRVITHGPSSVIIRQTHEFEIRVENRGSIDASGVMVRAEIPEWADIKGQSSTRGSVENQNLPSSDRLVWKIESLPAGTSEKMLVRLQALKSGTHDLDVDWTLVPQKSVAKIEVREPKLDLVIEGPEQVVFGESQTYKVRVLNPGDGIAPNVVFTLSPNSSTPQTQRIGNIPSGKEAQFEVELTAQDLGDLKIHGLASGDLGLKAQAHKTILVSAADLEAVLAGPEVKYQNTEAMYHLEVTNNGNATCKNINASLALPPGVRYNGGIDVAQKRGTKLAWNIESLPPGATREYEFTCTMVSPGSQTFDFSAKGSAAGKTAVALDTQVDSIADLVMTIQDPAAPAPVGSEVTYEILIRNRGSRQAKSVRAIAQFSNGIEPRRIEGHTGQVLTGQVLFDTIETIRPGEEVRIRVIAEAESAGHHRFRTEIRSGETVLVAEEATQYLAKRGQRVSRRSSSSSSR